MTPTEIRAVLSMIGGGANKGLGQHFLIDKNVLASIVDEAEIEDGDHVLEVGPGLGVLTGALIDANAHVTAVERDRRFIQYLEKEFPEGLDLVQGDAAELDWNPLIAKGEWKFISNLPYSITSLAIRKALYAKNPPTNLVVLVQREVAERIVARDQKHSLVSLMVAFASHETRLVKRVAAGAFFPPPKVESAILRVHPMSIEERISIWSMDPELIMAVAKKGFAHPRKLLSSNLGVEPGFLSMLDIPPKSRAEDLSPTQWQSIALELSQAEK